MPNDSLEKEQLKSFLLRHETQFNSVKLVRQTKNEDFNQSKKGNTVTLHPLHLVNTKGLNVFNGKNHSYVLVVSYHLDIPNFPNFLYISYPIMNHDQMY